MPGGTSHSYKLRCHCGAEAVHESMAPLSPGGPEVLAGWSYYELAGTGQGCSVCPACTAIVVRAATLIREVLGTPLRQVDVGAFLASNTGRD